MAFDLVYGPAERAYVALVRRLVHRPFVMFGIFGALMAVTSWLFLRHPVGFLPEEDEGYAILMARLPDGASQPRVMQVSKELDNILAHVAGFKAWVTIGGYSVLDGATLTNVFTSFVVFDDWDKRGADLTRDTIFARLRRQTASIQEANLALLVPPLLPAWAKPGRSR